MTESRGFVGRRGTADVGLPPGQYLTDDFPVLSAGPTPRVPLEEWELTIDDRKNAIRRWNWKAFRELPTEALVHSYGGYTTNLPVADLKNKKAWIAFRFNGADLAAEHGGPARLLVPHLYFWKSAKWVRGITLLDHDEAGFWERNGYHIYGDPWQEQRYSGD
jgi:DMSO/TMAO reductase YedYZ molybdopterin-dependent catalytic subunit